VLARDPIDRQTTSSGFATKCCDGHRAIGKAECSSSVEPQHGVGRDVVGDAGLARRLRLHRLAAITARHPVEIVVRQAARLQPRLRFIRHALVRSGVGVRRAQDADQPLASGESLLLFRKTGTGLRFEGEMICDTFHYQRSPDRQGNERNAIVFELRPLEAITEIVNEKGAPPNADLASLLAKALAAAAAPPRTGTGTPRNVYERSRDVRDYVLARAGNNCEGCRSLAPFTRKDGSPYLEPHHIRRLSDGGPDHPAFVIALCPNCHRRVHAGADGDTYNATLLTCMAGIQPKS
jgi:hypothetical protein